MNPRARKYNPWIGRWYTPVLAALGVLCLIGCETQTTRVRTVEVSPSDTAAGSGSPVRAVVEAPADLHDLSGFLLRYRVEYGAYPPTLAALREVDIMPKAGYDGLPEYAYAPTGLGTLGGGERIVVVDKAIRIADHVWCVLEIDGPASHTAALDVRLVPMAQLRVAARQR
ncbi:MAG: hypothetical protein AAF333_05545 [Planctomycetota bacterium]